uniref:Uncharacterized protein n=1 Tax=Elaeophora elaphi TaxID=1147741 RepID=A0A0R3RMY7_9BILA
MSNGTFGSPPYGVVRNIPIKVESVRVHLISQFIIHKHPELPLYFPFPFHELSHYNDSYPVGNLSAFQAPSNNNGNSFDRTINNTLIFPNNRHNNENLSIPTFPYHHNNKFERSGFFSKFSTMTKNVAHATFISIHFKLFLNLF